MAHHKRKKARIHMGIGSSNDLRRRFEKEGTHWKWYRMTPSSWHQVYHHRPRRRKERQLEVKIMKGEDPDGLAWPVARKPHNYYW